MIEEQIVDYSKLHSMDLSLKEYEIQEITYTFVTETRKLRYKPYWWHYKYYSTLESAQDALRDFRNPSRNSYYDDKIYLRRFKIVKRIFPEPIKFKIHEREKPKSISWFSNFNKFLHFLKKYI